MAMDETNFVTQIRPYDVTEVRDHGVAALILLAVSLDWNVLQKSGQPVKLLARDGAQKRLPTDTSCKLSVFQSALSTIMVHTEDDMVPTVELMDAIIAEVKPDREHARRLRLAVGETPAEHRERLANDKVAQRRDEEEHLAQSIGDAWLDAPINSTSIIDEEGELQTYVPFDGEEHGMLVSRAPYVAHYSGGGNTNSEGYVYESVTSLERIWEDGYKDYECTVCGIAKGSPRAVASHRQVHTKTGEVELDMRYMTEEYRTKHRASRNKRKQAEAVEFVEELPEEGVMSDEEIDAFEVAVNTRPVPSERDEVINAMIRLLLPEVQRNYDAVIDALTQERDAALKKLAEVEGEFDALLDLLNSRKRNG